MTRRTLTRRNALKTTATALAAAALPATAATATDGWTAVESPTDNTLHDVEHTSAGAYAVGGGGLVVERTAGGWRTVLDGGPTGNGNDLYGSDVTDDGERLWFVGSSGAIGAYDVTTGNLENYSAPNDVTNNFNDVAVTGSGDAANVYVAGDSGKIYFSFDGGETFDSVTPGSGSNLNALDFFDARSGHAVDGNKTVFATDDGSTYDRVGLADANVNFYAVDADGADDVWVAGGGGMIFRYDGAGWTPTDTGDASLRDLEVGDADDDGLAVGAGGAVYDLTDGEWVQRATPTGQNLEGVVRGDVDVAVGAGGTVLER